MRPLSWHPPVELSSLEQPIIARIKRAKLFVFLHHHRHVLDVYCFCRRIASRKICLVDPLTGCLMQKILVASSRFQVAFSPVYEASECSLRSLIACCMGREPMVNVVLQQREPGRCSSKRFPFVPSSISAV